MRSRPWLWLALALLGVEGSAFARGSAPTAPGKYDDWNDEVDQVEVVRSFDVSRFERLVVEPLDTSATPLPERDDNTYEPVKAVLASPTSSFVEGLGGALPSPRAAEGGAGRGAGTLVVRGRVLTMDPGSQAKRYFGGFGAGAARTEIQAEVVDGGNGAVLLRFRQERRSGVGVMGGDYEKLMRRNLRQIGEDLGNVLKAF